MNQRFDHDNSDNSAKNQLMRSTLYADYVSLPAILNDRFVQQYPKLRTYLTDAYFPVKVYYQQ